MTKISSKKVFAILIVLLFLVQISTSFYFLYRFEKLEISLTETRSLMNQNFDYINQNLGSITSRLSAVDSNINTLDNSLSLTQKSLSETQSNLSKTQLNLKSQIDSIKAKTSSDFSGIIENAVGSIVSIKTDVAQGTGFIISEDGYVVTNAHVLTGGKYANAITSEQELKPMTLIGYSSSVDLALLKISGSYNPLDFSNDLRVGEKVIAIGNPYGLSFSVSEGIISAVHRSVSNYGGKYIQTDAALNSGNSGGPLINTDGEVVGMNNFKIESGDNIGFSLESSYITEEVNKISMEKLGKLIL